MLQAHGDGGAGRPVTQYSPRTTEIVNFSKNSRVMRESVNLLREQVKRHKVDRVGPERFSRPGQTRAQARLQQFAERDSM